jgi:serine/threonine protein kinase
MNMKPGKTLVDDKYELLEPLGEGGMGILYRARQIAFDRIVALKFVSQPMLNETSGFERFEREAIVLSAMQHRNIVSFLGYGRWQNGYYIALEFVDGINLEQRLLDHDHPLSLDEIFDIVIQTCDALVHSHQHGIVHRDLKPANIMLVQQEERRVVKLIDFGLAHLLPEFSTDMAKLTQSGVTVGSVQYMAPEQCYGLAVDARTDVYALGCILHHCITGQVPFTADNPVTVMYAHFNQIPPLLADVNPDVVVPPGLQSVISKAMKKNADQRFDNIIQFKEALIEIKEGRSQDTVQISPHVVPSRPTNVRAWMLPLIAFTLTIVVSIVVYALFGQNHNQKPETSVGSADAARLDPSLILLKADKLVQAARFRDAVVLLEPALPDIKQSQFWHARALLAEAYKESGHPDKAITLLLPHLQSERSRPNPSKQFSADEVLMYSRALGFLGLSYASKEDDIEATRWLEARRLYEENVVHSAGSIGSVHFELGRCHARLALPGLALKHFRTSLKAMTPKVSNQGALHNCAIEALQAFFDLRRKELTERQQLDRKTRAELKILLQEIVDHVPSTLVTPGLTSKQKLKWKESYAEFLLALALLHRQDNEKAQADRGFAQVKDLYAQLPPATRLAKELAFRNIVTTSVQSVSADLYRRLIFAAYSIDRVTVNGRILELDRRAREEFVACHIPAAVSMMRDVLRFTDPEQSDLYAQRSNVLFDYEFWDGQFQSALASAEWLYPRLAPPERIAVLEKIAWMRLQRKEYGKCKQILKLASSDLSSIGGERKLFRCVFLVYFAEYENRIGDRRAAAKSTDRAISDLKAFTKLDAAQMYWLARAYDVRVSVKIADNDLHAAKKDVDESMRIWRQWSDIEDDWGTRREREPYCAYGLYNLSRIEESLGASAAATDHYRAAIAAFNQVKVYPADLADARAKLKALALRK